MVLPLYVKYCFKYMRLRYLFKRQIRKTLRISDYAKHTIYNTSDCAVPTIFFSICEKWHVLWHNKMSIKWHVLKKIKKINDRSIMQYWSNFMKRVMFSTHAPPSPHHLPEFLPCYGVNQHSQHFMAVHNFQKPGALACPAISCPSRLLLFNNPGPSQHRHLLPRCWSSVTGQAQDEEYIPGMKCIYFKACLLPVSAFTACTVPGVTSFCAGPMTKQRPPGRRCRYGQGFWRDRRSHEKPRQPCIWKLCIISHFYCTYIVCFA